MNKILLLLIALVIGGMSLHAQQPDVDGKQYYHCLYKNDGCGANGELAIIGTCGLLRHDPCDGMEYTWVDEDGHTHPAKCCSKQVSIIEQGNTTDNVVFVGDFKIYTSVINPVIIVEYMPLGTIIPILDFTFSIPDNWISAYEKLIVTSDSTATLYLSNVQSTAPYYNENETIELVITEKEMEGALAEFHLGNYTFENFKPLGSTEIVYYPKVKHYPTAEATFKIKDGTVNYQLINKDVLEYNPVLQIISLNGQIVYEQTMRESKGSFNIYSLKGAMIFSIKTDLETIRYTQKIYIH